MTQMSIDYKSLCFNNISLPEKRQFLSSNFGFFDTTHWHNLKAFFKVFEQNLSLEKQYFLGLQKERNLVVKNLCETKAESFLEQSLDDYFVLLGAKKTKILLPCSMMVSRFTRL